MNTYVESSSEDDSDKEVLSYLSGLSERERTLLLNKLEEKHGLPERTSRDTHRRKHAHKHSRSKRHSHSCWFLFNQRHSCEPLFNNVILVSFYSISVITVERHSHSDKQLFNKQPSCYCNDKASLFSEHDP